MQNNFKFKLDIGVIINIYLVAL